MAGVSCSVVWVAGRWCASVLVTGVARNGRRLRDERPLPFRDRVTRLVVVHSPRARSTRCATHTGFMEIWMPIST